MSNEERVLELARAAWRVSQPSGEQVDRAVLRVERRLRASGRPRERVGRRPVMIVAFAAVFAGAVAYAASGGVPWFDERPPAGSEEAPKPSEPSKGKTGMALPIERAPESPAPEPTTEEGKLAPPASRASGSAGARPSQAPSSAAAASTWRTVDRALAAEDEKGAERALGSLAGSSDPTTRAKAELGLAQLAQARGDCATARKHALSAAKVPGADAAVVRRARTVADSCDTQRR